MQRTAIGIAIILLAAGAHAQVPVADFYSVSSTVDGQMLTPGTIVEAFDGDGIRCGEASVTSDGAFLVHVYGDDPLTPSVDEGAVQGEFLKWRWNGMDVDTADATWISNLVGIFADLRWENGAAKQMQFQLQTSAVDARMWGEVKAQYRR